MALVGINPVSPPSQPQPQQKLSDFDKLMKGLQVAQSAFGIYTDYTNLEINKEKAERAKSLFPIQKENLQAGIDQTDAQTEKLYAETDEIRARPDIRKAEAELAEQKRLADRTKNIGGDIEKFRQTDQYRKNLSGVLAARYVEKALEQGSGPGDFIAAVAVIRQIAGDVGPMKESELEFIKGRLGITEKFSGAFDKWINNQSMQDSERLALMKAVVGAATQRRENLTLLETQGAKDIASKYRDVNYDDIFPLLDSTETFRVGEIHLDKLRGRPPGGKPASPVQLDPKQEQGSLGAMFKDLYKKSSNTFEEILQDVMSGD